MILRGMLAGAGPTGVGAVGEPAITVPSVTAPRHRFSSMGIMDGEPDLAARSARILHEELGNPTM
ncbi:hypothetical protein [Protofrankia symbiont of Coriaria ruscifolia]|uniref:Uncharacterized protein n=1 Tax=Candidatus Protofrankia californiensis TaxID=1839754 RepID=A0A1C3PAI6_9ACTN|nr:hypothetical protein [Protofrankia symbiont of Coriaria ruscifolia]SBW26819.1 hypothetical protein FDG2_5055 [Candidatus Protofrankia californiensis]